MLHPTLLNEKRAKFILVFTMFATAPMPLFWILCAGLLPPGMQTAMTLRLSGGSVDVFFIISAINTLIVCVLSYFVAHILVRSIIVKDTNINANRLLTTCIAILLLGLLPIYSFDCMDGRSPVSCNALSIYSELLSNSNSCGDL